MILHSRHDRGDSKLEDLLDPRVLELLRDKDVYWLTKQIHERFDSQMDDIASGAGCTIPIEGGWLLVLVENHLDPSPTPWNNSVVIHELTHLEQYTSGRLIHSSPQTVLWEGVEMELHEADSPLYWDQPWEQEALLNQARVLNPINPKEGLATLHCYWSSQFKLTQ